VRIYLKDTKIIIALGQRVQVTERRAMVAAEQHNPFAFIEIRAGFFFEVLQQAQALLRDGRGYIGMFGRLCGRLTSFEPLNVSRSLLA
jgi:hypothetical protein